MTKKESDFVYSLSDSAIGQVAKLVQVGILTETDVADNFRMLRLVQSKADSHQLIPDPEYLSEFELSIERLLSEAEERSKQFSVDCQEMNGLSTLSKLPIEAINDNKLFD